MSAGSVEPRWFLTFSRWFSLWFRRHCDGKRRVETGLILDFASSAECRVIRRGQWFDQACKRCSFSWSLNLSGLPKTLWSANGFAQRASDPRFLAVPRKGLFDTRCRLCIADIRGDDRGHFPWSPQLRDIRGRICGSSRPVDCPRIALRRKMRTCVSGPDPVVGAMPLDAA